MTSVSTATVLVAVLFNFANQVASQLHRRSPYKREAETTSADWLLDAEQSNEHALFVLRADPNSPPYLKIQEAQAEIKKYRTNPDSQVLKKALELQTAGTGILADAENPESRPSNIATFEHLVKALFDLLKEVAMTSIKPCNMDALMRKIESDAIKAGRDPRTLTKTVVEAAELVLAAIALDEKIGEFSSQ